MTVPGSVTAKVLLYALMGVALVAEPALGGEPESYSPLEKPYPRMVLWGDTHLHTSLSADANAVGNVSLTPDDAYRFARGEPVRASNGMKAVLNRPLDFLVVSDHAEYLGLLPALRAGSDAVTASEQGAEWSRRLREGGSTALEASLELVRTMSSGEALFDNEPVRHSAWQQIIDAAEAANDPGAFTTLAGFEWTSMADGNNLHRVVLFRDGSEKTEQITPFSSFDSGDPEDLWDFLADYESRFDGRALAIPHNGNLSNGLMFSESRFDGTAMDATYAERRQRWEPVVEVTQIKGDSETHPLLSPNDEFADYGTWDAGNLDSTALKEPWMLRYEYARSALRTGLELGQRLGVNPYRFGMIGSTDAHTALATGEEDNFWGKAAAWEPGEGARIAKPFLNYKESGKTVMSWEQLAGGYAAVWARENTREAVFDAFERREVYATTGPRMTVRFFGGWEFTQEDLRRPPVARTGYDKGVPMGAELPSTKRETPPSFMVLALKDPDGANLDRIQIVKGWLDDEGESHEKVYDLVWSGDRRPGGDGHLPPVGNTVDVESATYSNTIGAAQLGTVWTDPDFTPGQRAFYYVRVLQIPTPRWPAYDRKRLGTELPEGADLVHQERAYTSPIWYRPDGGH